MNGEELELREGADDIPPELDEALLRYFNVSEFGPDDDEDCGIEGTIIGLIYDGRASDWSDFFSDKKCTTKSTLYKKKEGLSKRQQSFIREAYGWIVYFSDTIQFLDLNNEERIIMDYIRKKFPGREGKGIIGDRVGKIIG